MMDGVGLFHNHAAQYSNELQALSTSHLRGFMTLHTGKTIAMDFSTLIVLTTQTR